MLFFFGGDMVPHCLVCRRWVDAGALCDECAADRAERVEIDRHRPPVRVLTLEEIMRAAGGCSTMMADAMHDAAARAWIQGSAYGWPRC